MVDTSVRHTWELDHTQFKLANPRWSAYVDSLLAEAVRCLGIQKMRAEPYKLLLYEEGSFFKRHKDSEKVPGMITYNIQTSFLPNSPSAHLRSNNYPLDLLQDML